MNDEEVLKHKKCPRCGSVKGQMRAGYTKSGLQRCVCPYCNFKYTLNPKYTEELKQEAVRLYKTGLSGREVGRLLNINKASVINWVRKYENKENRNEDNDGE